MMIQKLFSKERKFSHYAEYAKEFEIIVLQFICGARNIFCHEGSIKEN
jgi:hypothetical protein